MRIVILLFLGLLILTVLAVSDFILIRIFKEKIKGINSEARETLNFSPITWSSVIPASLLFWIVPIVALPESIKLEYRVFTTVIFWLLNTYIIRSYYIKKLPSQLVSKILTFLVIPAIILGVIIIPLITLIRDGI